MKSVHRWLLHTMAGVEKRDSKCPDTFHCHPPPHAHLPGAPSLHSSFLSAVSVKVKSGLNHTDDSQFKQVSGRQVKATARRRRFQIILTCWHGHHHQQQFVYSVPGGCRRLLLGVCSCASSPTPLPPGTVVV